RTTREEPTRPTTPAETGPATLPAKKPAPAHPTKKPPPPPPLPTNANNYLYFNPTNPGVPGKNSHSIHVLIDKLNVGLRIPLTQVVELSDTAPTEPRPPLKPLIEQTVTDFLNTSRAQDRVLVFFLGHYVEVGDEVFLVPLEGERENKETLIPLTWLYEKLAACKARQKVLVLDVCRFNPARGLERPGSGPVADAKMEGAMGAKLDAVLQAPPVGVQVWSSCVAEQYSYEYDYFNNGVFVEELFNALAKGLDGVIQRPEEPLPLSRLVNAVNAQMTA